MQHVCQHRATSVGSEKCQGVSQRPLPVLPRKPLGLASRFLSCLRSKWKYSETGSIFNFTMNWVKVSRIKYLKTFEKQKSNHELNPSEILSLIFQFCVHAFCGYFYVFLDILIQIQVSSGPRTDDALRCFPMCMELRGNEIALEKAKVRQNRKSPRF